MVSSLRMVLAAILGALFWAANAQAGGIGSTSLGQMVGSVIRPVMSANAIPGMAVGVLINGQTEVFDYGLAVTSPPRPVTDDTLFEIGSISKTFTATLAAYAQLDGDLLLTGMASHYLPVLRGSAFDHVSLIDLGTHTPGGLPLQVPDDVNDNAELMAYFKAWKPAYAPGTVRTYANPGIGLLGLIAARSMNGDFSRLVQYRMFPALGLRHSFIDVPAEAMGNYAEGYTDGGKEIRLQMGVAGPEAYGVRTTAADMLRFLAINMEMIHIDERWQRAVLATHTGYDQLRPGKMIQDLVWEQYELPVSLAALEAGNSAEMLLHPNPVVALDPPLPPHGDVLLNKTGSTNGFSAYMAFIPEERVGIVLLANKAYPIPARVEAAYVILTQLSQVGSVEK